MKEYEMGRACSTHGKMRNAYKILVGNPEGKRWMDHMLFDDAVSSAAVT
jgi:hypothetical protein